MCAVLCCAVCCVLCAVCCVLCAVCCVPCDLDLRDCSSRLAPLARKTSLPKIVMDRDPSSAQTKTPWLTKPGAGGWARVGTNLSQPPQPPLVCLETCTFVERHCVGCQVVCSFQNHPMG